MDSGAPLSFFLYFRDMINFHVLHRHAEEWFTPTIAFLLFGLMSAVVSLFLVETMSTIRGNENFQARVEYSTVAHLYLGDKVHILMQLLLYLALQRQYFEHHNIKPSGQQTPVRLHKILGTNSACGRLWILCSSDCSTRPVL